jgi:hypothetical protein
MDSPPYPSLDRLMLSGGSRWLPLEAQGETTPTIAPAPGGAGAGQATFTTEPAPDRARCQSLTPVGRQATALLRLP